MKNMTKILNTVRKDLLVQCGIGIAAVLIWSLAVQAGAPGSDQKLVVIEVYSGNGQVDSKYSMSMVKNLWDLKKEHGAEKAAARLSANTAFSVQSRIFDLSMRDPKKGQECKLVAKIKTSIGDSLLCQEDSRSIGKLNGLIIDLNKILAQR